MSTIDPHPHGELQDLLGGRLEGAQRERVEDHVRHCAACQREWDALVATCQAVRSTVRATEIPPELAARVAAALDREDAALDRATSGRAGRRRWYAVAFGAAAAVLVLAVGLRVLRTESLPAAARRGFVEYRSGELALQLQTGDVATLESFFTGRLDFRVRVLDLNMMQYALVGGRVGELPGRASAAFAYRGAAGQIVLCQMYPGSLEELPVPDEVREQNGIAFHVYRDGAETSVFWQEGDLTCVLVSDMPAEDVIQLAFAKAMKV